MSEDVWHWRHPPERSGGASAPPQRCDTGADTLLSTGSVFKAISHETMRLPDRNRLTSCRSPHTWPHETFRRQAQRRHPRVPEKSAPLAANARFLKRAQRIQRGLLCLGETPDARDSEPLVESIPPQRVQRLATLEVP